MEWGNVAVPTVQYSHGMLSCSEWTGVLLSTLLDEVGIDRAKAKFLLAEGADGASLTRTIPLAMALDDVWSATAQNGEMLRPEQGYPLRLLVPGVQGVSSVKWLRRIEVGDAPVEHARGIAALRRHDAGRHASPVHVDPGSEERDHGAVRRPGAARPAATTRSPGSRGRDAARCGASTSRPTAGATGARRSLQEPVLTKALTRFRIDWTWNGGPALLQSRVDRRHRLRAADDPAAARGARHALDLSQQRDPDVARRRDRRGQQCPGPVASRCARAAAGIAARIAAPLHYGFGKPATTQRDRRLGHRRASRRRRAAEGPRLRRRGPGDLRRQVRELPRHVRRVEQLHADRGRRRVARDRPADAHDRQQAQLRDHAVGLHQSRDAVQRAADAHRRRGLRADRVRAEPERHPARRRRARPGLAAETEDAQPRRLHDRRTASCAATASPTRATPPA